MPKEILGASQESMSTPKTPDLATSRHGQMAEAFELFATGMGPFIDERMASYFEGEIEWAAAAANRMGRPNEHGATDPLFQLLVLRRFWGPVFADFFGSDLRQLIGQIIEARNLWAHFNLPADTAYLDRILISIERVVAPVDPLNVSRLRGIRSRMKSPTTDDAGPAPRQSVDLENLLTQLGETEGAFAMLQAEVDSLNSQLDSSRKVAAGKQLRLTMMERELMDISGRSAILQLHLAEEQARRYRLEWLMVGFIAGVMLLILLIGA